MKICSLILARGGSKAIPGKNIIDINGIPLLQYTIKASQDSNVDETWVSSDCVDIRAVADDSGAYTIPRPAEISQDNSKSDEALMHFAYNNNFDILVFIQPTSPLLKPEDINLGLKKIQNCDSVFSVCREHWIPRWSLDIEPIDWNINNRPMRQDVAVRYIENGAFYITTREQLYKSKIRYGGKMDVVEMPACRSFQIDTREDLELIRKII